MGPAPLRKASPCRHVQPAGSRSGASRDSPAAATAVENCLVTTQREPFQHGHAPPGHRVRDAVVGHRVPSRSGSDRLMCSMLRSEASPAHQPAAGALLRTDDRQHRRPQQAHKMQGKMHPIIGSNISTGARWPACSARCLRSRRMSSDWMRSTLVTLIPSGAGVFRRRRLAMAAAATARSGTDTYVSFSARPGARASLRCYEHATPFLGSRSIAGCLDQRSPVSSWRGTATCATQRGCSTAIFPISR